MNLQWFDISMETSMRDIGWTYVALVIGVSFIVLTYLRLYQEGFRIRIGPNRCEHNQTRCLHGDEINHRTPVHIFRFWKEERLRRQLCLHCGESLDRPAICSTTGEDLHFWCGPWPYIERDGGFSHESKPNHL